MLRSVSLGFLACSLTACGDQAGSTGGPAAPASVAVVTSASAEPAKPPPPLIDLLYRTKARVSVSSNVQNPKDYPEHLIDHRPETAWNSKTGDLDARVSFRVPASARVRKLLLTVGYDKTNKEGDLFFLNHRIAQVAITREGKDIGTFDLNPEERKPQTIELDQEGGTFEIRATKTIPGTKAKWRELVISELVVLGNAPDAELLAPAMPQVTIGSLDRVMTDTGPFDAVRAAAPYKTVEAFCKAHLAVEEKLLAAIQAKDGGVHIMEMKAYCKKGSGKAFVKKTLAPPFEDLAIVDLMEGGDMVDRLMIKTDKGYYATPITFASEYPGPGCGMSGMYRVDEAAVDKSVLTLRVTKYAAYQMASPQNFESAAMFFIACKLDAASVPVCREELVASFEGDGSWTFSMKETQKWSPRPPRWDFVREASVDGDGQIRLSPCTSEKGDPVACDRHNQDLLRRF